MSSPSWLAATPPTVAIEIASHRVTVVEVPAGAPAVAAFASEPLPAGAVTPSLAGVNVQQPQAVGEALARVLERAGLGSTRRAALVVPDSIARVSLLGFDQLPARAQDLDQLVRWQLRKTMPFSLEEACVSHFSASSGTGQASVAAVVARLDVIAQYEAVMTAAGIHAGLVDLASFNVMNAVMASGATEAGDWLLVHLAPEATTLAILRGSALMFYRQRATVDAEPLGSLVHQTAMYHEDRLGGGGFARVWISGSGVDPTAHDQIRSRISIPVEAVDVRPAAEISAQLMASTDVLDALAAPIGVLLRERRAA